MDPKWIQNRMEARVRSALVNKRPFDQIKPPRNWSVCDVGIVASTFKPDNPLESIFPEVDDEEGITSPEGNLRYVKLTLPKGVGAPIASSRDLYHDSARAFFDEDIKNPALWFKSEFQRSGWDVWMSLSPMEIWSQRSGIRAATKKVALAGLGMGYLLNEVAKKPSVKEIVVIERDRELLDWFGVKLCDSIPKVIDIICDDFWNWADRFEPDCRMLIDIWKGFGDAAYDPRLKELRKKRRYVWAWGSPRGGE